VHMKQTVRSQTFAQHVFGFLCMLSLGLIVVLAIDYYQVSVQDVAQAAATLLLFQ